MGVLHQSHIPTSNLGSDMDCDVVTWKMGGIFRNTHSSPSDVIPILSLISSCGDKDINKRDALDRFIAICTYLSSAFINMSFIILQ